MDTWVSHVPKGMLLKSDGFASSLSAPREIGASDNDNTLRSYCRRNGIPYHDLNIPVALQTFVDYARDFQQRLVPLVHSQSVDRLAANGGNFELRLSSGDTVRVRRVILAVGITHFGYIPEPLAGLPAEFVTHSRAHHELDQFKGKDVTVLGGGASAIELAALLHEQGATVRLVVRKPDIIIYSPPSTKGRNWWEKICHPQSGLGPGWRSRIACDLPDLFGYLPVNLRLEIVRRHLGPAAAWHLGPRVRNRFPVIGSHKVEQAKVRDGRLRLVLRASTSQTTTIDTDHVISATGYRADVDRLTFIEKSVRERIQRTGTMPELSRNFESSVSGLYFVGNAAAASFGPLMRFVYGCEFTAGRISRHVTRH
jgi:thioredoxin reductase